MKRRILTFLQEADDILSGEQMSALLGVSRVSVWKHIRSLQAAGYPIESTPKGYRLAERPDVLQPWEFPGREGRMHCHDTVDSTMAIARQLARDGCPEFTVVTADRQTSGRGRLGRVWHSRPGGLYFTIVLRPALPAPLSSLTTFAAGLTWARLLKEEYGIDTGLKWPNDLLVGERKLSGMLSEMEAQGEWVTFVNIGIGINVNNDPTRGRTTCRVPGPNHRTETGPAGISWNVFWIDSREKWPTRVDWITSSPNGSLLPPP